MSSLVTVITPTYNHERYLRECIDSVLGQSHRDLQYIIINDGSTDDTPGILASYRDSRLTIIDQANAGETAATNRGLALASGDIVVVLSSDDRLYYTALAEGVAFLEAHPDVLVAYPGYCYIGPEGLYRYSRGFPPAYDYAFMVRRHYCTPGLCSFITRRALSFVPQRDPRYRYGADLAYWFKLGQYGPFAHIPKNLGDLRIHSTSGSVALRGRAMAAEHERITADFFAENNLGPEIVRLKSEAMAWTYLICSIVCHDSPVLRRRYQLRALRTHPRIVTEWGDLRWFR